MSAVFSVVEGVLLRPLPYPGVTRLIVPRTSSPALNTTYNITYPDFLQWREEGVFESAAVFGIFAADLTGDGEPARVTVNQIGDGYFETVRMNELRGRLFEPEEHFPGSGLVALLSASFWQSRYGGDETVLGRVITLRGDPCTIVGIVPDEAAAPNEVDVWIPLQPDMSSPNFNDWDNHAFIALARLRPGMSLRATNLRLAELAARIEAENPSLRQGETIVALPLLRFYTGTNLNTALWFLLMAVGFVLLVGCVNIANLMLALTSRRQREFAVRVSLGAGRARLIRQLLVESLTLALTGGAAGVVLTLLLIRAIMIIAPTGVPRLEETGLNPAVLLFTLVISTLAALIFGLVPALRAASPQVSGVLSAGAVRATSGRRERRGRNLLIGLELALSLTLLAGAGYAIRSVGNITRADLGFDHARLLRIPVQLPATRYGPGQPVSGFYEQLIAEVAALPGVSSATVRSAMPIGGGGFYLGRAYLPRGRPEPPEGEEINGPWTVVGPDHFTTMGIPLLAGRDFEPGDNAEANPVMIVNRSFARAMFSEEDPLGKQVRSWRDENIYRTIVGVVADVRYWSVVSDFQPCVYIPHRQNQWRNMQLVVRTAGDPLDLAPDIRRVVAGLDPDLLVADIRTMEQVFASNLSGPRFIRTLLVTFAAIALLLAATGLFGVLSFLVSLRTREIGLRMAVGACRGDVMRLILGDSWRVIAIGLLAGLGGVIAIGSLMQSLLFEVATGDPVLILTVVVLLAGVSLAAAVIPARRAAAVEPAVALRVE